MALKIVTQNEQIKVNNITVCIYAPPGYGKTSTAFTAKKALLFDFDKGAYRSQFRKDTVQIEQWLDVTSITEEDLKPYDTVIVDTVGRALDTLTFYILQQARKQVAGFKGAERAGGLSQQGWGVLKTHFIGWLTQLRSFGKDVILLSHMTEEKQKEEIVERLDIQGGAKNEVYKVSDLMGRLAMDGNQRILTFDPDATGFGKNPVGLPIQKVPNFKQEPDFLAKIIDETKGKLNALSEQAQKEQQELENLRERLATYTEAEAFNKELEPSLPIIHKRLIMDYATKAGLSFDKDRKEFVKLENGDEV